MKKTRAIALILCLCMLASLLSACTKKTSSESKSKRQRSTIYIYESEEPEDDDIPVDDIPVDDPIVEAESDIWDWPDDDDDIPEVILPEVGRIRPVTRLATPVGITPKEAIIYDVNVVQIGADPTGRADSTEAIQRGIDAVANQGGGTVYIPSGRYRLSNADFPTIVVPSGVTLMGDYLNPYDGGLGKGTILHVYNGRGLVEDGAEGAIYVNHGGTLKGLSFWYPEQDATNIVPYPYTIVGDGHVSISNITLYNSHKGIYISGASSCKVRDIYGTILNKGIHAFDAYDVPRFEKIEISTEFWSKSGFKGAPKGSDLQTLKDFTCFGMIAMWVGRQDWAYWYDVKISDAKMAFYQYAANNCYSNVETKNVGYAFYVVNMGNGLMISDSKLGATESTIYYKASDIYFVSVLTTTFTGKPQYNILCEGQAGYPVSINNCVFENWQNNAIKTDGVTLSVSNSTFKGPSKNTDGKVAAFEINKENFKGGSILLGNKFSGLSANAGSVFTNLSPTDPKLKRDDTNTEIPKAPAFEYPFAPYLEPEVKKMYNVKDYGAKANASDIPEEAAKATDDTAAIQATLDLAAKNGGGFVVMPSGLYKINGSLKVPKGVELRGVVENLTTIPKAPAGGTVIYAYGGKGNANGAPLIDLAQGAGVRGIVVYYPEQGTTLKTRTTVREDSQDVTYDVPKEAQVKAYPWTVRANRDSWVNTVHTVNAYQGFDFMTNNCSNSILADIMGAPMYVNYQVGNGTRNHYYQDVHYNLTTWTNNSYLKSYSKAGSSDYEDFSVRNNIGMIMGDVKDSYIFNSFNILMYIGTLLVKDPHTGGSFDGVFFDYAYDGCHDGIVATKDSKANLTMINCMGVYNQTASGTQRYGMAKYDDRRGYGILTEPGFSGTITHYGQVAWSGNSSMAKIQSGTVNMIQNFVSRTRGRTIVMNDATLNLYNYHVGKGLDDTLKTNFNPVYYLDKSKGKMVGCVDYVNNNMAITVKNSSSAIIETATNGPFTIYDRNFEGEK